MKRIPGDLRLWITAIIAVAALIATLMAPCSWLDWMPAKDVPARCFPGVRP